MILSTKGLLELNNVMATKTRPKDCTVKDFVTRAKILNALKARFYLQDVTCKQNVKNFLSKSVKMEFQIMQAFYSDNSEK